MTIRSSSASIFRRHIALPQDHGSWVFILSPLLIGIFAGGSFTASSLLLVVAEVCVGLQLYGKEKVSFFLSSRIGNRLSVFDSGALPRRGCELLTLPQREKRGFPVAHGSNMQPLALDPGTRLRCGCETGAVAPFGSLTSRFTVHGS